MEGAIVVAEEDPRPLTIGRSWLDRLSAWVLALPVVALVLMAIVLTVGECSQR